MGSDRDRRANGASRISFEGIVELGGPRGAAFEAQGIDLSAHGMHLRTAYLPEVGQELTCRFDAGPSGVVLATGEVVWRQEGARGGEFGLRFKGLDADSAVALREMMGPDPATEEAAGLAPAVGTKVRLHIEGLGQPMRAKVKSVVDDRLQVGSELGFLRMGREVGVEDPSSGDCRAAQVERVQVKLNEAQVPELVVSLRYEGSEVEVDATVEHDSEPPAYAAPATAAVAVDDDRTPPSPPPNMAEAFRAPPAQQHVETMRKALAESAARVGPALAGFAQRARTTVEILSNRTRARKEDEAPPRRTTAPAPRGGLHATGRRVVREEVESDVPNGVPHRIDRRKIALGAAGGLAVILGFMALRKPAAPPVDTAAAEVASASPADSALANLDPTVAQAATAAGMPGVPPAAPPVAPSLSTATVTTGMEGDTAFDEEEETGRPRSRKKKTVATHVVPFGGAVSHPNVLKLKMDGPIEKLQGAALPTGFTVVIPERHSLEPAAPLASRDARIASMRVANDPTGAELSVTFKDGVPPYQVRARGDVLEIAITSTASEAEERPATARVTHGKHEAPHGKKKKTKH